jgi:hypothetical protein
MAADPIGNVTPQGARPVADVTAREAEVQAELRGWWQRLCERNAAQARKEVAQWSRSIPEGTLGLSYQYQAGVSLEIALAWENRAEAARERGVMLVDQMAAKDPKWASDHAIKQLQQRCMSLGLVEWEPPSATIGSRF